VCLRTQWDDDGASAANTSDTRTSDERRKMYKFERPECLGVSNGRVRIDEIAAASVNVNDCKMRTKEFRENIFNTRSE